MSRYLGGEPCTNRADIIRYLRDNYIGDNGKPMTHAAAQEIVKHADYEISRGIRIFRSNVYYLGDQAVQDYGGNAWHQLPAPEDEDDDDDT